nr:PREDICTED: aminopeptidase M1-like isoform X2 [Linepithema humile]
MRPVLILNRRHLSIKASWTRLTSINHKKFSIVGFHAIGYDWETLITYFKEPVPLENYILRIKFKSISQDNFIQSYFPGNTTVYPQDRQLILTQFGKHAVRQLFPCWDHEAFKATFKIIIEHSEQYTALSNMPLSRSYDDDNIIMIRSTFDTTPIMSIHQLVIVLLPFTVIPNSQFRTVHTWCESNVVLTMLFTTSFANKVPNHLHRYTNIPPEIPKIDHVVIWDAPYSEAHWGLIIHKESDVIYNKATDSTIVKIQVATSVANQVAHQWFGGLVTPNSWTHSWLITYKLNQFDDILIMEKLNQKFFAV